MTIREVIIMITIVLSPKTISSSPLRSEYDKEIETNTIDSDETTTDKDDLLKDPEEYTDIPSTTTNPLDDSETRTERNEETIILKTFVYDGPLIIAKLQPVKLSEKISIFSGFRSVIRYDDDETNTVDSLLIVDEDLEYEYTTTEFAIH